MILFCGDPHGYFEHIIEAVQERRPEAVILLGDLQPKRPLEVELAPILTLTDVWFIHGNHDSDSGGPLVFSAITGGTQTQHWRGGGVGRSLILLAFLFTSQTGIVASR